MVVVGLGNVGTSVVAWFRGMGDDVVGVDSDANARGVPLATQTRPRTPIVIGDASLEKTLKDARLHRCRALVVVTDDDTTNLVVALQAHAMREKQKLNPTMSDKLRAALSSFHHLLISPLSPRPRHTRQEKLNIPISERKPTTQPKFRVVLRSLEGLAGTAVNLESTVRLESTPGR